MSICTPYWTETIPVSLKQNNHKPVSSVNEYTYLWWRSWRQAVHGYCSLPPPVWPRTPGQGPGLTAQRWSLDGWGGYESHHPPLSASTKKHQSSTTTKTSPGIMCGVGEKKPAKSYIMALWVAFRLKSWQGTQINRVWLWVDPSRTFTEHSKKQNKALNKVTFALCCMVIGDVRTCYQF